MRLTICFSRNKHIVRLLNPRRVVKTGNFSFSKTDNYCATEYFFLILNKFNSVIYIIEKNERSPLQTSVNRKR